MKKIIFIIGCFLGLVNSKAQSIEVDNPVVFNWPTADSTVIVDFYLKGNPNAVKYKIIVTDLFLGSAIRGKDYEFNTTTLTDITDHGSFQLTIKSASETKIKTMRFNLKATAGDTISQEVKITLAKDLGKVKKEDKTNTPKFEFINYTDFKGFDQDQPNGVAQSQFLFKLPINRYYKQLKDGETKIQWFRSFILPNFLFNRIDKTDQPVTLQPVISKYGNDSLAVSQVIGTFDFIRYSNFILNSKLAVFTVMRPKSRFQFQLNGSLYKIKVDSAEVTTSRSATDSTSVSSKVALNPIYASGFGAEIYYDTKFTSEEFPFNFRFILGGQAIRTRSSEYTQADVAVTTPDNRQKAAVLVDNGTKDYPFSAPIWSFSAMIKKNLDLTKNKDGEDHYLFFRFNYSWQQFKGKVAVPNRPGQYEDKTLNNNFSQFQLGIDLNFDGFFK